MKNCYSAFDPPPTYRSELAVEQAEQRASDASTIAALREQLDECHNHFRATQGSETELEAQVAKLREQLAEARELLDEFSMYSGGMEFDTWRLLVKRCDAWLSTHPSEPKGEGK